MMTDLSSLNRVKFSECLPRHLRTTPNEDRLDAVRNSFLFLSNLSPLELEGEELEVAIMHTAYLVDDNNGFFNNINISPERRNVFIEHVDLMRASDIQVWCRKLYDYNFWKFSNSIIANVIYNWIGGTLDAPRNLI
jgi:hypothetical protein